MPEMVDVTHCLLCNGKEFTLFLEGKDRLSPERRRFTILQCQACGFCFTSPRPATSDLMNYYPPSYVPWNKGKGALSRWLYPFYYQLTRRLVIQKGAKLLEVGCGAGIFLECMAKKGIETYGCDIGPSILDSSSGFHFFQGAIEEAKYPTHFFDAVVVWHVLEHVVDPPETLHEISRVLKEDGQFLLSVPNIEGLDYRCFGVASPIPDLPRHLYHFSKSSLERLLSQTGFHVERKRQDLFLPGPWIRSLFYILEDRFSIRCSDMFLEKVSYVGLPITFLLNLPSNLIGAGNSLVWLVRKDRS